MTPAPSLVVFTVLSGLGLGLIVWIGLGFGPSDAEAPLFAWLASLGALVATGAGGVASAGHLARPDRAWRAFSQWRSSWLSREACLLVLTAGLFVVYAAVWVVLGHRLWGLGWAIAALAVATIYCTAMIYAQLPTVPRWSTAPTPALFLAFGALGGFLALETIGALSGGEAHGGRLLLALALGAGVTIWWQTAAAGAPRSVRGSTLESATGLGRMGRVRAFEPPHTGPNYLLEEMAFAVGRKRAHGLRWVGAALGFLAPAVLVVLSWALGDAVVTLALLAHLAGAAALRWLFFAEAEHVQALYYGASAR
ncbi:MAG: DmsC/YnfH family molybdoenzyme membrane anchor subunit [Pseudomonadota bacterium]